MSDTRDPAAKLKRLAERLAEEATKVGLTMRGFSYSPNMQGDGPDTVQAVFSLDGEIEEVDPAVAEQKAIDAEFERMMRGDQVATVEDQAAKARKELEERLAKGGILADDDEDDDSN